MPSRVVNVSLAAALFAIPACTTVETRPARDFVSVDAPAIALTNAKVIDGTGAPARTNQTIVIQNGQIAAVGAAGTVQAPVGARVIDLSGRTVVPGFVMLHEHLFATPDGKGYVDTGYSFAPLYLAGGATTIRTGGSSSLSADVGVREAIKAGDMPGPDIDVTSPYLNPPGILEFASGENRGRKLVAGWAAGGATSVKVYTGATRAELAGAIAEAHGRGLKVTGHLCAVTYAEAADLEIDNLEHGLWAASDFVDGKLPDQCPASPKPLEAVLAAHWSTIEALIAKLVSRRVAITSTLTVFETFVPHRPPAPLPAVELMAPDARDRYERHRTEIDQRGEKVWAQLLRREMAFEKAFVRAGGLLVAGTDPTGHGGSVAGFANQRAIQLLVEAGFTVPEAVRIATLNGAKYLGRDQQVGSIAAGKQADLVVLQGDPEERISAIEDVETVFRKGVGYDPAKLRESVRGMVYAR